MARVDAVTNELTTPGVAEGVRRATRAATRGDGTRDVGDGARDGGDRGARDGGADAVGVRAVRKGGVPDRVGGRRREEVAPGGVF